jgi:AraC-like DNA-binding protein
LGAGHGYSVISVGAAYLRALYTQISGKIQPAFFFRETCINDRELRLGIGRFFRLLERRGSGLEVETLLQAIFSRLLIRYAGCLPADYTVVSRGADFGRVCEYMGERYGERFSLQRLSKMAGLSRFHFQRLFSAGVGLSPYDYLLRLRIRAACRLISAGKGLTQVALECGFSDQSHFSHVFRKETGVTPGLYRRNTDSNLL